MKPITNKRVSKSIEVLIRIIIIIIIVISNALEIKKSVIKNKLCYPRYVYINNTKITNIHTYKSQTTY